VPAPVNRPLRLPTDPGEGPSGFAAVSTPEDPTVAVARPDLSSLPPAPNPAPTPAPRPAATPAVAAPRPASDQPQWGKIAAIAGVSFLAFVGLGGVALYFALSSSGLTDPPPPPVTPPVATTTPSTPPSPPPAAEAPVSGTQIVKAGTFAETVPVRLSLSADGGAVVEVKGPSGFHARWDGKAQADLGGLGAGMYNSTLTLPDGTRIYSRRFTVEAGKPGCEFTFDLTAQRWDGGCR
jgi:hypothetical protein